MATRQCAADCNSSERGAQRCDPAFLLELARYFLTPTEANPEGADIARDAGLGLGRQAAAAALVPSLEREIPLRCELQPGRDLHDLPLAIATRPVRRFGIHNALTAEQRERGAERGAEFEARVLAFGTLHRFAAKQSEACTANDARSVSAKAFSTPT